MHWRCFCVFLFASLCIVFCGAAANTSDVEARGKKKKIGLLIYFLDLIVKKVFVLKLIYAFVFWLVIHKAGYFLGWFISYLKEKKHEHKEVHHEYVDHSPHHHYEYGPPIYGPPKYGPTSYGPYKREAHNIS